MKPSSSHQFQERHWSILHGVADNNSAGRRSINTTLRTSIIIRAGVLGLVLTLAGIVSGLLAISSPVDIREQATTINTCQLITGRCVVDVSPSNFHPFRIEVEENGVIMQNIGANIVNQNAGTVTVEFAASPLHNYICRTVPITSGGIVLDNQLGNTSCQIQRTNVHVPVCFDDVLMITTAPVPVAGTDELQNSQPTPELPPVFPGCPALIEPILCVTYDDGTCIY